MCEDCIKRINYLIENGHLDKKYKDCKDLFLYPGDLLQIETESGKTVEGRFLKGGDSIIMIANKDGNIQRFPTLNISSISTLEIDNKSREVNGDENRESESKDENERMFG